MYVCLCASVRGSVCINIRVLYTFTTKEQTTFNIKNRIFRDSESATTNSSWRKASFNLPDMDFYICVHICLCECAYVYLILDNRTRRWYISNSPGKKEGRIEQSFSDHLRANVPERLIE